MKPVYRRIRRRNTSHDAVSKKDNQTGSSFFGGNEQGNFFQPAFSVQRKCADCENEEKGLLRLTDKKEEDKLQKKGNGGTYGTNIHSYVNSLTGKGSPMPEGSKQFFSSRMGYDFTDVKLHTDKEAAESAKAVNAKAYTVGNNIVFNEGQHNEETAEGKSLMAHELVHVMQQADYKKNIQRITCDGAGKAPPRMAQGKANAIDTRAQQIIDIATSTASDADKAVSIVTQIICKYYPSDTSIVDKVVHNSSLDGLDTTSKGKGASATGSIGVGDKFVQSTTTADFARRVLQVGHEIQHIHQYRSGLAGKNNKDEREFLAFADNALADEFEGTGRMRPSTTLSVTDAAIGYYFCLSATLQTKHKGKLTALQALRAKKVSSVKNPKAEPTACTRP